jgi:DUF4097 and DUF4098 domain-containing protein YvlB
MSSPVQVPASAPQARRSFAGPVVLIILGIIFLLGTMGILNWYDLGRIFAHYWPVLIIVWGLIKLAEHMRAQQTGTRASGIGVGGVFLLIFLIAAGLIASQISRVNWGAVHDQIGWDDGDFGNFFGQSFSYSDQISQAFPAGASLHVVSDRGAVKIVEADTKEIKVVVDKRVHADNQQNADKYNNGTKPQLTVSGNVVNINANTQGAGEHGVTTDLTISIPRKAPVTLSTRHGDVTILGRDGAVDIANQHGDVTVADINGNASLNLQHSSAKVSNITGDVAVDGRVNDISISGVKGALRLTGEFMESVKLSNVAKMVSFKSARTDMEFAKLDGTLDLDSGDLRASSPVGPGRLITKSKDIHLEGVSGDLHLEDSNGAVEVSFHKLGNLQVDNKNGDIQLSLPTQASFKLDARAQNGEIQSDFAELKINNGDREATASGSVGGGNISIRLNNQHGTIEIHKGSIQATTPPAPPTPKAPRQPPDANPVEPSDN